MKQKLLSLLTLLLVCCCHLQIRAAEIEAPVEPDWTETAVAPVSGHVYYIKCVDDGYYLRSYKDGSRYNASMTSDFSRANSFLLEKTASGWTMRSATYGVYISDNGYSNYYFAYLPATPDNESYCIIDDETSAGGHHIMRSELHKDYSDVYKYWEIRYGDIHTNSSIANSSRFVFIDAEVRERYLASKQLYNAILVARGKNLYVTSYENFYNNRNSHSVAEIYAKANELVGANDINSFSDVVSPNNEVPLIIYPINGNWKSADYRTKGATISSYEDKTASLGVTFSVDKPASLFWQLERDNYRSGQTELEVFVDGEKAEYFEIPSYSINYTDYGRYNSIQNRRILIDVEAGEHTVEWKITNKDGLLTCMYNIGVMQSPLITVSLAEPGSLGTEVLYNVDGLKDVKSLKVIGKMNADDWAKIAMMDNLMNLDLSQAVITEIPEKALSRNADESFGFLHNVVLPEGLITIGDYAFQGTYLNTVNIPSTVTTIGRYAFYETNLRRITMPNSVTSIGDACFSGCYALREVKLSNNITSIPDVSFSGCYSLEKCDLPEGLTSIGNSAFYNNYRLSQTMPSTLWSIGNYAYYYCLNLCGGSNGELIIPENVATIGHNAFQGCMDIATVDLPTQFYCIIKDKNHDIFTNCPNITKIILRSPTLVTHTYRDGSYNREAVLGCDLSKVDLYVPDYLVPNYKLDEYWYNYKTITGFSTADIQDWTINNPLTMNDRARFLGTPNITINGSKDRMPSLKINGEAPLAINNLYINGSYYDYYYNFPGQIYSNCSNVTIAGDVLVVLWSKAKYWYFFSLPFDIKVSEIIHSADGVQKAVRYYDGATRALSGSGANWKNYDEDAIIPAGTGFIMQTNTDTWNYFWAIDNASKQQIVKNVEFVKALDVNDSQTASNKGWNLVGNPWQCFYNNHMLNFTGPITVWNVYNKTYSAYSLTDDDYAIRPNESFFVQCPSEEFATIGFPVDGRQVTDVIESQNAAKPMYAQQSVRKLVNVVVSDGDTEDQARVVLNENASLGYETICDAAKMMSMDAQVPQIYTLDNDATEYAINERPVADGVVKVGFYAGHDGEYTIRLGRCDAERVYLTDNENGETVELTDNGYSFSANAGVDNGRFTLRFNAGETTGIFSVENNEQVATERAYNIAGQRISRDSKGIVIVNGKKIVNK